jgi:hypothetical protein
MQASIRIGCISLTVLLFALSIQVLAQDKVMIKRRINIQIPADFKTIEDSDVKKMYQNKEGESFGFKISGPIDSQKDVEDIAAITLVTLSKTLDGFSLIDENKDTYINNKKYDSIIYSCSRDAEEAYCVMLMTSVMGRLVTYEFACPLKSAGKKVADLEDIMNSLTYNEN